LVSAKLVGIICIWLADGTEFVVHGQDVVPLVVQESSLS